MDLASLLTHLRPNEQWSLNGDLYEGLTWLDVTEKPTLQEIEEYLPVFLKKVATLQTKQKAQTLLSESDWADLVSVRSDLQNVSEWDNYRSAVRQLRTNPVENPVFPDKPQVLWKTQTQNSNSGGNT